MKFNLDVYKKNLKMNLIIFINMGKKKIKVLDLIRCKKKNQDGKAYYFIYIFIMMKNLFIFHVHR